MESIHIKQLSYWSSNNEALALCQSGEVAITIISIWSPGSHFEIKHWPNELHNYYFSSLDASYEVIQIACYLSSRSGDHIYMCYVSEANFKMDTLAGSWIPVRLNYRHNQVHCTWFHVCICCGSGGVAITNNSTWPPDGHIKFRYWPKKCMSFINTTSVTQLLDM